MLDDRDEFGGGFTLAEVTRLVDKMEFILASEVGGTRKHKQCQTILESLKRIKKDLEAVA